MHVWWLIRGLVYNDDHASNLMALACVCMLQCVCVCACGVHVVYHMYATNGVQIGTFYMYNYIVY